MKAVAEFVKTTLVGGVLFLVPVVLVVLLIGQALKIAVETLGPVARLAPARTVAGVVLVDVLAIVGVVAICFVVGLLIRTRPGRALGERLEYLVLSRVPGFTLVKSAARGLAGVEAGSDVSVALARIEDAWVLAFIVERPVDGYYTVFVPSAPTPAAGSIYYLTEDRLRPLDIPVGTALACIMRLGVGSGDLLRGAVGKLAAAK